MTEIALERTPRPARPGAAVDGPARDLSRLLRPKSIALFGGRWAVNVAAQLLKSGYAGDIWPVNPKRSEILGVPCFASIDDLPATPDAAFIGVNREASVEVVRRLSQMGAGGATCFASGFGESEAEGTGGLDLQARLVEAAGDMPILGPNCYGYLNYLDNVTLWPDQHGGASVESGVAIVSQSSNIAINMTMQRRGLPIAYVVAAGNQAQIGIGEIASTLLDDRRVTALGFYLEGFGDIRALEAVAGKARSLAKPLAVLKAGRTDGSRLAAMTHTASIAGSAAASSALLERLGIAEVHSVETFLETLKLLSAFGSLPGNAVVSVSCSGGEASLMSDMAAGSALSYRSFSKPGYSALKSLLGPIVTITNPLDYHTFIWGDTARMTDVFAAVMGDAFDLCLFVLDIPRDDRCDSSGYECAVEAIIAAGERTGARVAVLALVAENLSETMAARFAAAGIVTLNGMAAGIAAADAAIRLGRMLTDAGETPPLILRQPGRERHVLDEAQAKHRLAGVGVPVPSGVTAKTVDQAIEKACAQLRFPVALKALGIAHKTEAGAVRLGLADGHALTEAARTLPPANGYLVEEMIADGLAELIVGITREETGLLLMAIGAGGVLTEILRDTASLLLPTTRQEIVAAVRRLRIARLLAGYRGRPAAAFDAIADAILSIARYAESDVHLQELDVNPLIVRERDAIAADALIVTAEQEDRQ